MCSLRYVPHDDFVRQLLLAGFEPDGESEHFHVFKSKGGSIRVPKEKCIDREWAREQLKRALPDPRRKRGKRR